MNILRKGKTPNNTDIQIEDWSINYPNSKSFIIGFIRYPRKAYTEKINRILQHIPKEGKLLDALLSLKY